MTVARDRTLRRYLPPEVAAKHLAIVTLLRGLPGYWLPAEDIAPCVRASIQATSKICTSLAAEGLLESRVITRTAARCRTRKRREFRFAENRAQWPRHPAWLEPPLHPIDQTKCRRITGRNHIKEHIQMTEAEYRALPRGIREKFSSISDEQIADHPDVVAARQRVEAAEAAHRSAYEAASKLRQRKVAVEAIGTQALAKLRELHAVRVQAVCDALLVAGNDVSIKFDVALRDDTERLSLISEAAPIALKQADEQLAALNRRIQLAANDCLSATEDHRATLDALKLAAAQA